MTAFGLRLRHLRKLRQLQSRDLAARMGVTLETVSRLEHGKRGKRPSAEIISKASEALGVPTYYFTAARPENYIKQCIKQLTPEEQATLTSAGQRMAWVLHHLSALFPKEEFSAESVMVRLGLDSSTLEGYEQGRIAPTPALLREFEAATGTPIGFLIGGVVSDSDGDSSTYYDAVELAKRLGIGPDELIRLIRGARLP